MAPKKTNIKIKRSKFNLYNKKKSKARRALKIIITVIVVCGLGVLGYGLGKPLIKYFQDKNSSQPESEASALLSSIIKSGNTVNTIVSSSDANSSEDNTSKPEPAPQAPKIYYLSDNAASSEANLTAALADAKKSGCSVVAVTLKDTSGYLLYKSSIASVKDTEVTAGTLSASQVSAAISKEGLTPAARINTLMDKTAPAHMEGGFKFTESQGGYSWHDNKPENGGKMWLSPFSDKTVKYIGDISEELSKAGFKHIICANTRFPGFHTVDVSTYLTHLPLNDRAKRSDALWNVLNSAKSGAEKNGAKLIIEVSASSIMAVNRSCSDAEFISDKDKLNGVSIIVNYDITKSAVSQTPTSSGTSSRTSSSATQQAPITSTVSVTANAASGTTSSANNSATTSGSTSGGSNGSAANSPDFTATPGAVVKTVPKGTTEYEMAKNFAAAAKSAFGSASFSVRLPQTLTGTSRQDVVKALSEANVAMIQ